MNEKKSRTEEFEYWKEKPHVLLYNEKSATDRPPMTDGHKIYLPKYLFGGKVPSKISVTIEWEDDK
jgi:hypothetical protein